MFVFECVFFFKISGFRSFRVISGHTLTKLQTREQKISASHLQNYANGFVFVSKKITIHFFTETTSAFKTVQADVHSTRFNW
jgi:hypothetical protein